MDNKALSGLSVVELGGFIPAPYCTKLMADLGASVVKMIEAILQDKRRILPCTAYLEGEYGWSGIFFGVPVMMGIHGIEKVIELNMTEEEKAALDKSAQDVKKTCDEIDAILAE